MEIRCKGQGTVRQIGFS